MRATTIGLVLLSVALSSGAQVALKAGMISPAVQAAIADGSPWRIAIGLATSPLVVLGLFCIGLSAAVWLAVLSHVPLSIAYPFVALGIAVTVLCGRYLFGEALTSIQIVGTGLILTGIVALSLQGPG